MTRCAVSVRFDLNGSRGFNVFVGDIGRPAYARF